MVQTACPFSLGSRSNHTGKLSASHQVWPCLRVLAFSSSLCPESSLCSQTDSFSLFGSQMSLPRGATIAKGDPSPPLPCPCVFLIALIPIRNYSCLFITPPPLEQQSPESRTRDCPSHSCAQHCPSTVPDTRQASTDHVLTAWGWAGRRGPAAVGAAHCWVTCSGLPFWP